MGKTGGDLSHASMRLQSAFAAATTFRLVISLSRTRSYVVCGVQLESGNYGYMVATAGNHIGFEVELYSKFSVYSIAIRLPQVTSNRNAISSTRHCVAVNTYIILPTFNNLVG